MNGNVTSCKIDGKYLEPKTTYYYRVRAKNTQGQSLSSNRVATDLPSWIATALEVAEHSKVTYDLDTNTVIFDESVLLINPLTVPVGEPVSIYVPTGVTITGKEDQPAINAEIKAGETVSLTVYGTGTEDSKGNDGIPVLHEFSESSITANSYSGTYDGCPHYISVSAPGATVKYSLTENGEYCNCWRRCTGYRSC